MEASAGTGKTYNIASLYVRALTEQAIPVSQILVVTYTDAATKELKDRLLERISESIEALKLGQAPEDDQYLKELIEHTTTPSLAIERLRRAVRMFDEAAVYTIHGFCYQVLQEQAFQSGTLFGAEMIGDDSEMVLEVVDDFWRNWVREFSEEEIKRPLLKYMFDRGCDPEDWAKEIGAHLGKAHMQVLPQEGGIMNLEDKLRELHGVFSEMRAIWQEERGEIIDLLSSGLLKYYTSKNLSSWLRSLEEILSSDVPPIKLFDKFERFTQSYIDGNLKKGPRDNNTPPPQHAFFKLADTYWELTPSLQGYESMFKKDLLQQVRRELDERKQELGVLSYNDLLLRLQQSLNREAGGQELARQLNEKYPIALVDEFQDTDPAQYDIFRNMYAPWQDRSALFMIGDPKQSIYSFRGADVYAYLRARQDADPQKMFSLANNYRSTPILIEGLNALFRNNNNPFVDGNISYKEVSAGRSYRRDQLLTENGRQHPPVRFRRLPYNESNPTKPAASDKAAADTAAEINRLIEGGRKGTITIKGKSVEAKDIAVLVRTHRQANLISEVLQEKGINNVQYSQESVFQSLEASQLEVLLMAVAEPANEIAVKTALSMPLMDYTAHQLFDIEENESQWLEVLQRFAQWHRQWREQGFQYMFRSLLKEAKVCEQLMLYANGERRLTNLLHLGELLQAESRHGKSAPRGLLKWLGRKRTEEADQQEEAQLRLESDEELVKIVTMHRSKGLEYPIVFCPFLWKGPEYKEEGKALSYHREEDDQACLDFSGKSADHRKDNRVRVAREELAESMRLAYVALTRAEHCCYISATYATKTEFSPLGYLFLEEKTLERLELAIHSKYQKMGGQPLMQAIERLAAKHPDLFSLQSPGGQQELGFSGAETVPTLQAASFRRGTPLAPQAPVSSFSALTSWMKEGQDGRDYDALPDFSFGAPKTVEDQDRNIFSFPKGPQPGNCIHSIFEELDFGDISDSSPLIQQKLEAFGIEDHWEPVVREMLGRVLDKPLLPDLPELKLSDLPRQAYLPELEFYYPSDALQTSDLLSVIRPDVSSVNAGGYAREGFMKGFIDLTFRFGDKYYLLDYKTNYLGDTLADYHPDRLEEEMQSANYDLQYHIYSIALHRYLQQRLPGYRYEQHFGGSFYLFLRGVNRVGREGIYFDRPSQEVIEALDGYISEEVLQ